MSIVSVGSRLFRTLARVIPRCGMISQAVAFNMFLAFFPSLLVALGLLSGLLREKGGGDLAGRLAATLPPGSWRLVSDSLLHQDISPSTWVVLGWAGTFLIGSQVMKLLMEGIHLIYGIGRRHSFLGRQLRALLLFSISLVAWLVSVLVTVFGPPLGRWLALEFGLSPTIRVFWIVALPLGGATLTTIVLALIYRVARPGATTLKSVLPGAAAATILWWGANLVFGFYVRQIEFGPLYGGLAAAIGVMVWMECSAMIVFVGAAWNAESASDEVGSNPMLRSFSFISTPARARDHALRRKLFRRLWIHLL